MDADRNAVKPAVVLKLQDVKFIYQETIQPEVAQPTRHPARRRTKKRSTKAKSLPRQN
jgi:hypothetical protein